MQHNLCLLENKLIIKIPLVKSRRDIWLPATGTEEGSVLFSLRLASPSVRIMLFATLLYVISAIQR